MRQCQHIVQIDTEGPGMTDITAGVARWLAGEKAGTGLLTLFIRHTSASLTIQENADPTVQADLMDALDGLASRDAPYRHHTEGPDDMPAHIKAAMMPVSLSIPVSAGKPALGTWQGIYLFEHRNAPHTRRVAAHFAAS